MGKELGKIKAIRFGWGGYQDAMIGVSFELGGDGWGTGDFWGYWGTDRSEGTQWTEEDRTKYLGEVTMKILGLLKAAKKNDINGLVGVPVEVMFLDQRLISWRILQEVV